MASVCKHGAWAHDGKVILANDQGESNVQEFASRADLDAFIVELLRAADEAWPDLAKMVPDGHDWLPRQVHAAKSRVCIRNRSPIAWVCPTGS